ncbi:MAG: hypothetical protein HYU29_03140 [Chloroflexi bacterium]|nr:hypothetical protein [Chloroflexota bacterium]
MANVRIDANGLPKGPVFESLTSAAHRTGVTTVDASDPAGTAGAVDCGGYEYCRFDIEVTGTGFNYVDVQVLFWNSRQSKWFGGASQRLSTTGRYSLVVDARGSVIYLKLPGFSGTSFSLGADYILS